MSTSSNPPVGWAFIGSSGWVDSRFAGSVTAGGGRVVGAFGSSASGSEAFAERHGARPFQSLDELLADDEVDAVWVASPTALHADHARAAAAAGKAVLVEKPVAVSASEARRLAADLSGSSRPVGAGFQHRFNPGLLAIRDLIAEGRLGTLSSVVVHHSVAGPPRPSGWRNDPELSGGWSLSDLGAHLVDTATFLVGPLRLWSARLSSPGRSLPVDDLSQLLLTSGEVTVSVRASTGTPGPPSAVEVAGTKGWARVTGFWTGGGELVDSSGLRADLAPFDIYEAQVRAFCAAVRGDGWDGATLEDGVVNAELLEAARNDDARRRNA